jgi:hypothetical protein
MRSINAAAALVFVGVLSFVAGSFGATALPRDRSGRGPAAGGAHHLAQRPRRFRRLKRNAEQLINQAIGQLETGKQFAASRGY